MKSGYLDIREWYGLNNPGLKRECPKCGTTASYEDLKGKKRDSCCLVECKFCGHEFEIVKGLVK